MKKLAAWILVLVLFFYCILFLDAAEKVAMKELKKPSKIQVYEDELLITDFPRIYIYDVDKHKLKGQFGEGGEGPREFKNFADLTVLNNRLLVYSESRLSTFSRKGDFREEHRLRQRFLEFVPHDNGFISLTSTSEDGKQTMSVRLFDGQLQETRVLRTTESKAFVPQMGKLNPILISGPDGSSGRGITVYGNRIYLIDSQDASFEVYDFSGNKIASHRIAVKQVAVSESDKERYLSFFKHHPNTRAQYEQLKSMFTFPKYFPLIRSAIIADGRLYVRTFRINETGSEFYVFDLNGELIFRRFLPLRERNAIDKYPFTINGNRLFQLVDNLEAEEWELLVTVID